MPSQLTGEITTLDRDGVGVQAVFTWLGDRYGHSIYAVKAGRATPLLEAAPPPPLQEAVKHKLEDGRSSLLFTGSDGRYWSATLFTLSSVNFAILCFDFACRRKPNAELPSIAYALADGISATPVDDYAVKLRTRDGREFLLRSAELPTSIETASVRTCRLLLTQQVIRIEPLGSPHVSTRETVQWRYEVSAFAAG